MHKKFTYREIELMQNIFLLSIFLPLQTKLQLVVKMWFIIKIFLYIYYKNYVRERERELLKNKAIFFYWFQSMKVF